MWVSWDWPRYLVKLGGIDPEKSRTNAVAGELTGGNPATNR